MPNRAVPRPWCRPRICRPGLTTDQVENGLVAAAVSVPCVAPGSGVSPTVPCPPTKSGRNLDCQRWPRESGRSRSTVVLGVLSSLASRRRRRPPPWSGRTGCAGRAPSRLAGRPTLLCIRISMPRVRSPFPAGLSRQASERVGGYRSVGTPRLSRLPRSARTGSCRGPTTPDRSVRCLARC
jgi:hypothetical protein